MTPPKKRCWRERNRLTHIGTHTTFIFCNRKEISPVGIHVHKSLIPLPPFIHFQLFKKKRSESLPVELFDLYGEGRTTMTTTTTTWECILRNLNATRDFLHSMWQCFVKLLQFGKTEKCSEILESSSPAHFLSPTNQPTPPTF